MNEIQISSAYFYLINTFIEHCNAHSLFTVEEIQQLHTLAQQDFLQKHPLSLFNFYVGKFIHTQHSDTLFLDITQHLELKHYGLLGYLTNYAKTAQEALNYLEKFHYLVIDQKNLQGLCLIERPYDCALKWGFWGQESIWLNEINMAGIFKIAQQLSPKQQLIKPNKITFAHSPQMPLAAYQQFFQCEVVFNCPDYALYFPYTYLNYSLPHQDHILLNLLLKQAEAALQNVESQQSNLKNRIISLLNYYLQQQEDIPELDDLADKLYLSKRTLQRKLSTQGIVYRKLIFEMKMQHCQYLLQTSKQPLSDIALQLGYTNQSSLARAFKQYFGFPMTQIRKNQQQ